MVHLFLVVSPFVLVSVFVQTCIIFLLLSYWLAPGWAEGTFRKELPLFFERGPALDTGMYLIWASAALLLGMEAGRWAYRRLRPSRRLTNLEMVRSRAGKMGLLQGWLLIAGGAIGLLAVLFVGLEIALTVECAYYSQGRLPDWAPADWWPLSDLFQNCQTKHKEGLSFEEALSVVYTLGVLVFAVNWLLRGVRTVRSFLGGVSRPRVGKECG